MFRLLANPWVLLGLGIALLSAFGGTAWKAYHMGQDSVIASQAKAEAVRRETREIAMQAAAAEIAKIKVQHVTVRQETEREIIERPLPAGCVVSDRLLQLTNEAIMGTPADRAGELPAAGSDDGEDAG